MQHREHAQVTRDGDLLTRTTQPNERVTLRDLAEQLHLSIGTVSRALQNNPRINALTRERVMRLAGQTGYVPNLAARSLVTKRTLKIGVNTPREIASFYDAVRRGINDESRPFLQAGVDLEHRIFSRLGAGECEAFEQALDAGLDGLIVVPGDLPTLRGLFRRAARLGIPVICLATDAPDFQRLASVSVNTRSIGALAGDLMGRFSGGKGKVAVTSGDLHVADHIQKLTAFTGVVERFFPRMHILPPLENHEVPEMAYEQITEFLQRERDLAGMYISTGNGAPVLRALEEAGVLGKLTVIATNVFASAVPHLRSGALAATLYERPYSQGRSAFRLMHEYLVEGKLPVPRIAFEPLVVMRSNIDAFVHSSSRARSKPGIPGPGLLVDEMVLFDASQ